MRAAGFLEDTEKIVPADTLVRCHKSYIVNLKYVTGFSRMKLSLMNGGSIPVSRSRKEDFEARYLAFKGLK